MTIHIDNPEIEQFFVQEFKSDIKRFTDFVLSLLDQEKQKSNLKIPRLDPEKHSYTLEYSDIEKTTEEDNPYKNIDNVAKYAQKLRENAWR